MPPIYTPKQVKALLSLPGSTLRRYAKVYADYLSQEANQKRRNYIEQDITTLARIRDLSQLRRSVDEIKDELQLVVDDDQNNDQADITALALPGILEQVNEYKTLMQQAINAQRSQEATITAQQDEIDKLTDRLQTLEDRQLSNRIKRLFGRDPEG